MFATGRSVSWIQQVSAVVGDAFLSVLQLALTSFGFWSNYIPHLPWKFPSADESTGKFAFFTRNTWSFLISFYLIIKKHFADINLQICLLALSQFTVCITDLETEAQRSLVTIALERKSVFNGTQFFILINISLYISSFF